jgi:hypothetical protein
MLLRLLSAAGRAAYVGQTAFNNMPLPRALAGLRAPVMGAALLVGGFVVLEIALAASVQVPTRYTVEQLATDPSASPDTYISLSGSLRNGYAESTYGGRRTYDYLLVSPTGEWGVVVRSSTSPWDSPVRCMHFFASCGELTFVGTLRAVDDVQASLDAAGSRATAGTPFVTRYVLVDGDGPPPARPLLMVAVVALPMGGAVLLGWSTGYVAFARDRYSLKTGLMPPWWLAVRITGTLKTPTWALTARDLPASLVAVEPGLVWVGPKLDEIEAGMEDEYDEESHARMEELLSDPANWAPDPEAPTGPDRPVDLICSEDPPVRVLRLTPGCVERATPGTVWPFGGPSPALRLRTTAGTLLIAFDKDDERDRTLEQLRTSGRLVRLADGDVASSAPGGSPP